MLYQANRIITNMKYISIVDVLYILIILLLNCSCYFKNNYYYYSSLSRADLILKLWPNRPNLLAMAEQAQLCSRPNKHVH